MVTIPCTTLLPRDPQGGAPKKNREPSFRRYIGYKFARNKPVPSQFPAD